MIAFFIKRVIFLYRSIRLHYFKFIGTDPNEHSRVRLIYIGEGEGLRHLERLNFSKIEQKNVSILPLCCIKQEISNLLSEDAVFFVEVNRLLNFLIPSGGFFTFPWIRQKVFLKSKNYKERKKKINEVFARKTRKYGHSFILTRDRERVVRFYKELYAPYISKRFKDASSLRSIEEIQDIVKSGFLLQVFEKGIWISGAACRLKGTEVAAYAFGLRPDYKHYLKRGALSSAYFFLFKWAEDNSIQTIDLLRSRPHIDDGVYEHKRRWGAMTEIDEWPHTAIWIFIPNGLQIPSILRKQLVWHKNEFVELEKLNKTYQ